MNQLGRILLGFGATFAIGLAVIAANGKRQLTGPPRRLGETDDDDDDALFEPETSDKWKAMIAKQKARKAERKRQVKDALTTSPALIVDNGYTKQLLLVTGEMQDRDQGAFRVTTFGDDGPIGHATRKDMDAITEEIIDNGWKTLRPATDVEVDQWTSSEKFVEGSKRVAATQAINTLHWRASQKGQQERAREIEAEADKHWRAGDKDAALDVLQRGVKELSGNRARLRRV